MIAAFVLGYRQENKLYTTFLLPVTLTALVFFPCHFISRTQSEVSIDSIVAVKFASFFAVLLE